MVEGGDGSDITPCTDAGDGDAAQDIESETADHKPRSQNRSGAAKVEKLVRASDDAILAHCRIRTVVSILSSVMSTLKTKWENEILDWEEAHHFLSEMLKSSCHDEKSTEDFLKSFGYLEKRLRTIGGCFGFNGEYFNAVFDGDFRRMDEIRKQLE